MGEILFCNKCGTANAPGAQFCTNCGAVMSPVAGSPATAQMTPPAVPYPYQPATAHPAAIPYSGMAPIGGVRYGGFWIRFVAAIIDGVIVQVVVMPLSFIVGGVTGFAGAMGGMAHAGLPIMGGILGFFIGVGGAWLYEALMESSTRQATLGKMIFGMRVTDLAGNRISFARATGRHFGKWISALVLFIGYIMAGFTERKQALHDMLAGTLVRVY
jgi:uncharacterized RDD family membrane protein YckC